MPLEKWSDRVVVARLADDPQLTEDLLSLDQSGNHQPRDVVLDFSTVNYVNSSHLSRLLRLRKRTVAEEGRLILCGVVTQVWGTFLDDLGWTKSSRSPTTSPRPSPPCRLSGSHFRRNRTIQEERTSFDVRSVQFHGI